MPLTLRDDPRRSDRGANFLRVIARLGPGVSLSQAKTDLDSIARQLRETYPTENARKIGVSIYPLHAEIVRDYQSILWALFAAVGVLLAIGCGNLANLLLVRAAGRQTEFAIRLSLGASLRGWRGSSCANRACSRRREASPERCWHGPACLPGERGVRRTSRN